MSESSHAKRPLRVRHSVTFLAGIVLWIVGWVHVFEVLTAEHFTLDKSTSASGTFIRIFVFFFFFLLVGPLVAVRFSTKLTHYADGTMEVSKLLGFKRRRYLRSDVESFDLVPTRHQDIDHVVLRFSDGVEVKFLPTASDVGLLLQALESTSSPTE